MMIKTIISAVVAAIQSWLSPARSKERKPKMLMYAKGDADEVSKHFNSAEFHCKCQQCAVTKIDEKLIVVLEGIRSKLKAPLKITSGYRCEDHNRAIGGVENSTHTRGLAADIVGLGVSTRELAEVAMEVNADGGVGVYIDKGFVHVDVRGRFVRWQG